MRFTPAQIAAISRLRGSKVPWPVIIRGLKATIVECGTAIRLPTHLTPERQAMPWHLTQQTLPFDK